MGSDALVVAPSAPGGPGADEMGRIVKLVPDTDKVEKHVLRRVELCQRLGKGAYGVVWKAIEKRTRRVIALKKCYDAFRGATDAQRTYREVMYLTLLAGHDNLVRGVYDDAAAAAAAAAATTTTTRATAPPARSKFCCHYY
jgi:hypothetical protein